MITLCAAPPRVSACRLSLLLLGAAAVAAQVPESQRTLVVFAHPDDAETICGGLVSLLVAQGTVVHYLVVTNGDKGWNKNYNMTSAELVPLRQAEQLAAAAVLGVANVTFLGYEDGELEAAAPLAVKRDITRVVRTFQPDLVVTFSPDTDFAAYVLGLMHRDHQTAGMRAVDAVYPAARTYLMFPDLFAEGLMPWRVPTVWLFAFEDVSAAGAPPGAVVDISGAAFEAKYAALLQHQSQYTNATDVLLWLQQIGSGVAAANGLPAPALAEAYTVVAML
jgi:LmbE family N-acetylglucosaminyl deacetylase